MKREEILFYMATNKIYMYLLKSKKEYIFDVDTSLFFKRGEISDVLKCSRTIAKLLSKMNFGMYYLKPNLFVLYNDVCSCDAKFLYSNALAPLGYNKISFVALSKLAKTIRNDDNLVISDGNYYTIVNRGEKLMSLQTIDFDPIILGRSDKSHVHYSDLDLIWRSYKTYFTNRSNYDMIDVGDDNA